MRSEPGAVTQGRRGLGEDLGLNGSTGKSGCRGCQGVRPPDDVTPRAALSEHPVLRSLAWWMRRPCDRPTDLSLSIGGANAEDHF